MSKKKTNKKIKKKETAGDNPDKRLRPMTEDTDPDTGTSVYDEPYSEND